MDLREQAVYVVDAFKDAKDLALRGLLVGGLTLTAACGAFEGGTANTGTTEAHAAAPDTAPGTTTHSSEGQAATQTPEDCGQQPPNPELAKSENVGLRRLAPLEAICGTRIFEGAMQFFGTNADDAKEWQADGLKQQAKTGLASLSIIEPTVSDTESIDMAKIAANNPAELKKLSDYFAALKSQGVSAEQLGTVVVCGEYIVGDGRLHATAANYPACVSAYISALKKSFPTARTAIMLDMAPEEQQKLAPVYANLPLDKIDEIGIQAFDNGVELRFAPDGTPVNLTEYFDAKKIIKVAQQFPGKPIWINTGINGHYSFAQRQGIAKALAKQLQLITDAGVVTGKFNLFAQPGADGGIHDFAINDGDKTILATVVDAAHKSGAKVYGYAAHIDD